MLNYELKFFVKILNCKYIKSFIYFDLINYNLKKNIVFWLIFWGFGMVLRKEKLYKLFFKVSYCYLWIYLIGVFFVFFECKLEYKSISYILLVCKINFYKKE